MLPSIFVYDSDRGLNTLTTERALSFLRIFGHLIRSLSSSHHYIVFEITQQYCSKTWIYKVLNIDFSKFQALEELRIRDCLVNKLYLHTKH